MVERHSIVTVVGRNKEIAKMAVNQAVIFTQIALGDGTRFPSGGETTMENELYRADITGSGVEPGEPDAVWFDLYVPANVATIQVQEIGLFDEDGVLYALSRFDQPVPKFGPDSTALSDQTFRIVVVFSDTENILVTLSPVAGVTPDTLPQYLPFATDPEFDDPTTTGRIAEVAQIYKQFTQNSVLQNNLAYPEVETVSAKLAITDNADGTLTIDPAQTWLWRGVFRYSSDDILLADRTVSTVASKTYHLRWHAPGTGTAIPEATYPNGRFELADLTGANPAEGDVSYDTTYDRMLIARIVTDAGNIATITVLKNLAVLSEEIRWAVMTKSEVTAPLYYEGFSYGVVVPARTSNSWGGVMILPPAPLALNWSRSPSAAWQVGFFTGNTINNDPPVVADKDGETLTDGSGSAIVINNRYQQYPVARADSNTGNLIFDSFMAQFKGVLNA